MALRIILNDIDGEFDAQLAVGVAKARAVSVRSLNGARILPLT